MLCPENNPEDYFRNVLPQIYRNSAQNHTTRGAKMREDIILLVL